VNDFWYRAEKPGGLQIIGVELPDDAFGVAQSGNYSYVADGEGGLRIIKLW